MKISRGEYGIVEGRFSDERGYPVIVFKHPKFGEIRAGLDGWSFYDRVPRWEILSATPEESAAVAALVQERIDALASSRIDTSREGT